MAFTGNWTCDTYLVGMNTGQFDLSATTTQVFKLALYTNSATLNQSTTGYTATGEVVGTGYSAGGAALTISVNPTTGGSGHTVYYSFSDISWPAATFTARGALLYRYDGMTNPAMIVLDFGSDKTVSGQTFTVQFPPANSTSAIVRIAQGA